MLKIITQLVPDLSPDREATLAPLRSRIDAARAALVAARDEHGPVVERLARVDLVKLQPRLKKEFYSVVGVVRAAAIELRAAFAHADVPVDLHDALRAAASPTASAAEFTGVVQRITRDADRYAGNVEHVDVLAKRLVAALAVLEDADTIWSDSFVVAPRQEFGWTAEVVQK
jgi:hypothetical protein